MRKLTDKLTEEPHKVLIMIPLGDDLYPDTLSPDLTEIVHTLREGLSAMSEKEDLIVDVKVPSIGEV